MNKIIITSVLLFFAGYGIANTAPVNIVTSVTDGLKKTLPEVPVDQVNKSVFPGVYEVISGRKVFYVDAIGHHAMLGKVIDLTSKEDLTQQKVDSLSVVDWSKLPLKIAIRRVLGKGERKLAVFTDPDCQFCKRFDAEVVPKLINVTVYYFLYPLPIHLNAENNSKRILCSSDPDKTFVAWMVNEKKLPIQSKCEHAKALEQMKQVGSQVVLVDATPTLILPDGKIINGMVPADYINKLLTDTSPAPESAAKLNTSQDSLTTNTASAVEKLDDQQSANAISTKHISKSQQESSPILEK
jgi:thiol:disulfide interchange protein DsbC